MVHYIYERIYAIKKGEKGTYYFNIRKWRFLKEFYNFKPVDGDRGIVILKDGRILYGLIWSGKIIEDADCVAIEGIQ
ncbi:hypothetical protein [Acidianus sp. RZ1]|uniref:hypothetical protein n=1 Tax=Acidianus sp. RZ1 TaxID=1540082 RepID=UPI00149183C1|nr:hypothetical protein [Acidianus sp. RZ1]NON61459.1 hypothetical protein [Acidianus sp. RZ1]